MPTPALGTNFRLATMAGIGAAIAGCSWVMPSADVRGTLAGSSQPLLGSYQFADDMKSAQVSLTNANRTLFCIGAMKRTAASIGLFSIRLTPSEFRGELRCDNGSTGDFFFQSDDSGGKGLSGTGHGSIGSRAFTFVASKESRNGRTEESRAGDDARQSWRRIEARHGPVR